MKDNEMERYIARLSFNQKAWDERLSLTFTGAMIMNENAPTDTRNFVLAYNMIPVVPIKFDDEPGLIRRNMTRGTRLEISSLTAARINLVSFFGNVFTQLELFDGFTAALRLAPRTNVE